MTETTATVDASPSSTVDVPARSSLKPDLRYVLFLLGGATAVCLVTLYFFCPRFYLWRGAVLEIPELTSAPEINRSVSVLKQLEDPRIVIDHPSNLVVNWRLFFPWIGHLLHLPAAIFLSISFVGCWVAALLFLHILARETGSRRLALFGTTSLCCTAWFFVSTGWLTYNDSWIIIGLTAVAAIRSRSVLFVTCLIEPWIEERFLLVLPTALALRLFFFSDRERPVKDLLIDTAIAVIGSAPYIGIRVYSYLQGTDPVTAAYVKVNIATPKSFGFWTYVNGTWAGLRCNWYFVVLWSGLAWFVKPRWLALTAVVGVWISVVAMHIAIPGDLHRNAGTFAPVALAGMVAAYRRSPQYTAKALKITAVLSLLLPAGHVITVFKYPVFGAFVEWENYQNNTNPLLSPQFFNDTAIRLSLAGQIDEAMIQFDKALRIDPNFQTARVNKAIVMVSRKRFDEALTELNVVLATDGDHPEAHYARGVCYEAKNKYKEAVTEYDRALKSPRTDWPFRAETERLYKRLRGVGITPIQ